MFKIAFLIKICADSVEAVQEKYCRKSV